MYLKRAECLKLLWRQTADAFILQRRHAPILEIFMSDGTPFTSTSRVEGMMDGERLHRSGKTCKELLIQRVFLMDSNRVVRPLFEDPLAMQDKTAWTL